LESAYFGAGTHFAAELTVTLEVSNDAESWEGTVEAV